TELNADVERELHFRRTGDLFVVLIFLAFLLATLLFLFPGIPEQGRADAVFLLVERASICEILDLTEHLHADAPMLCEVIFGAPAIFKTKTLSLAVRPHLVGEKRVEYDQKLSARQLDDGTEAEHIRLAVRGLLISHLER